MKISKLLIGIISAITTVIYFTGCEHVQINDWQSIKEGIDFKQTTIKDYSIIIVRINPLIHNLKIILNDEPPNSLTIKEIQKKYSSPIAWNGSFFTPEFKPTGLLISEGKILYNAVDASLTNGIFAIDKEKKISIKNLNDYFSNSKKFNEKTSFAVQSGPILIKERKSQINNNKNEKKASRTVMAKNEQNQIILLFVKQTLFNSKNAISLFEITDLILNEEELKSLNITEALNLDGGKSSGLAIGEYYYSEIDKVQNVIITENYR